MGEKINHVEFELTYLCNLRCLHCFNETHSKTPQLDTEQVKNILDQIKALGINEVHFNGGEPLTRSDIYELLEYSTKIGLITKLETNAILLSRLDFLVGLQNFSIRASIDGPENIHNIIRESNKKGINVFKETMENLRKAKNLGIQIQLTTSINKLNYKYIYELTEQTNNYGMTDIRLRLTLPVGFALDNWDRLGDLNEEDTLEIEKIAKRIREDFPHVYFDTSTLARTKPGVQNILTINPEGKVKYYKFTTLFVGDLKTESLEAIVNHLIDIKMKNESTEKISRFIDQAKLEKSNIID